MGKFLKIIFWLCLFPVACLALYTWASLQWVYSSGERVGYIQKLSNKGWICKTWEGELVLVTVPGTQAEKFYFTVRDEAVIGKLNLLAGERVRLHNRIHAITGVLLFDGLNFTQYFEGNDADVDNLLANILKDTRHKHVNVLVTGHHQSRLYAEWQMGYVDISDDAHALENPVLLTASNIDSFRKMVGRFQVA